jgi:hypothetical protein
MIGTKDLKCLARISESAGRVAAISLEDEKIVERPGFALTVSLAP